MLLAKIWLSSKNKLASRTYCCLQKTCLIKFIFLLETMLEKCLLLARLLPTVLFAGNVACKKALCSQVCLQNFNVARDHSKLMSTTSSQKMSIVGVGSKNFEKMVFASIASRGWAGKFQNVRADGECGRGSNSFEKWPNIFSHKSCKWRPTIKTGHHQCNKTLYRFQATNCEWFLPPSNQCPQSSRLCWSNCDLPHPP